MGLIDVSPTQAYVVDIFRIGGGKKRDYLFHALSGDKGENFGIKSKEAGVTFVEQKKGTLAGEDVEWTKKPGYGFIVDIKSARSDGQWTGNWWVGDKENTGLRLTMLGAKGRGIILGKGEGHGYLGRSP